MEAKERVALIREGNAAFNAGDVRKAREIFLKTDYKDGLIRMGDYFMFDKKLPILAYGYYKKAGHQQKVDEVFQRMIFALSQWLGKDKFNNPQSPPQELDPNNFIVHPLLKKTALEILQKNGS